MVLVGKLVPTSLHMGVNTLHPAPRSGVTQSLPGVMGKGRDPWHRNGKGPLPVVALLAEGTAGCCMHLNLE
jgi:hypothetical protein